LFAPRRKNSVTIAIPASIVADTPHLREKTYKIGLIGRAAAIFRIENIAIYQDLKIDQTNELKLIELILSYMATPQYLRKRLFKVSPQLQYAGILPPLRTPNHPLGRYSKNLKIGEFREGVIINSNKKFSLIDIGVEKPAKLNGFYPQNMRLTVKISNLDRQIDVDVVHFNEIDAYWGYKTYTTKSIRDMIDKQNFDLKIATSKYGKPFNQIIGSLNEKWKAAKRVLVAFGSPTEGLREILAHENRKLEDKFHFIINTIKDQGTETVRTEEALLVTLANLNLLEN
jgi:predicted SPOUT superfamily RNA methylase MTH1